MGFDVANMIVNIFDVVIFVVIGAAIIMVLKGYMVITKKAFGW
jgi:hypothetical protein